MDYKQTDCESIPRYTDYESTSGQVDNGSIRGHILPVYIWANEKVYMCTQIKKVQLGKWTMSLYVGTQITSLHLGKLMVSLYVGTQITSLHVGKWIRSLYVGTDYESISGQMDGESVW